MAEGFIEHVYKKEDIEKAYDMGWENAIMILEKSIGMSVDGQKELLSMLKKMRSENRIKPLFRRH
ncbi:MAG: hypothetical protein PVG39_14255 [Desulfobacteraceae bacterium]|jgi:hypothetical protein